jgi:hypothetical protein
MAETTDVELETVKGEIRAMRDSLEAAREAAVAAEQRANAEHRAEIDQLQATIAALRAEMIRQRDELLDAVHAAQRDGAAEAEHLREAVVAGRRHADDLKLQHDAALALLTQRFESDRRDLQNTITELRRRLEIATTEDDR